MALMTAPKLSLDGFYNKPYKPPRFDDVTMKNLHQKTVNEVVDRFTPLLKTNETLYLDENTLANARDNWHFYVTIENNAKDRATKRHMFHIKYTNAHGLILLRHDTQYRGNVGSDKVIIPFRLAEIVLK